MTYNPNKLDRSTRNFLEARFRERQQATLLAESDTTKTTLVAHVTRRLHAKYDEMQTDMPTLVKYHCASRIKGINLSVYDPATKRYDERVGVEMETDLFAPQPGYTSIFKEETTCIVSDYVRENESDYADFWTVIEFRRGLEERQKTERAAFAAAIRETTSLRVLMNRFDWIAELYAPKEEAA